MFQVKGPIIPMDQLGRQFQLLKRLDGFFITEDLSDGGCRFLERNLAQVRTEQQIPQTQLHETPVTVREHFGHVSINR